jgi:hypothetical protein
MLTLGVDFHFQITDVENWTVFDRDFYLTLLKVRLEKEEMERNSL